MMVKVVIISKLEAKSTADLVSRLTRTRVNICVSAYYVSETLVNRAC